MYCVVYVFAFAFASPFSLIPHERVSVSFVHSTSFAAVDAVVITTSFHSMNINEKREEKNQPKSFFSQEKKKYFNRRSVGKFLFCSVSLCLPFHRCYVLYSQFRS